MTPIELLLQRLKAIATKNKDQFRYRIDVTFQRGRIMYTFVCEETADGHTFVDGTGLTIDDAAQDADKSVPAQCEQWGYKE